MKEEHLAKGQRFFSSGWREGEGEGEREGAGIIRGQLMLRACLLE